jgi:hypothetical protein
VLFVAALIGVEECWGCDADREFVVGIAPARVGSMGLGPLEVLASEAACLGDRPELVSR